MKTAVINNDITLAYPDSFDVMENRELEKYFHFTENRWGARDPEKHAIISSCKINPGIMFLLTDPKSIANGAESAMKRNLSGYKRTDSINCRVCGKKAQGIAFEYKVEEEDVVQSGELVVFRFGTGFYAMYFITRQSDYSQLHSVFEKLLYSIKEK